MPHNVGTEGHDALVGTTGNDQIFGGGDDTITISRYGELSLTPAPLITIDGGTGAPRLRP